MRRNTPPRRATVVIAGPVCMRIPNGPHSAPHAIRFSCTITGRILPNPGVCAPFYNKICYFYDG